MLSRTHLSFYDRREVHTRALVTELSLSRLTLEECELWMATFESPEPSNAAEVHRLTGGHPLALELLELYGSVVHGDWMRFLDEEILDVLPAEHRDLLAYLAVASRPVPWPVLARAAGMELPAEHGIDREQAPRDGVVASVGIDEPDHDLGDDERDGERECEQSDPLPAFHGSVFEYTLPRW